MRSFIALSAILFASTSALALDCRATVNDQGHVVSDPSLVDRAASSAASSGATIKVVTFDTVPGGKSLHQALEDIRLECPMWANIDKKRLANSIVIIGYSTHSPNNPAQPAADMAFGASEQPFLGNNKQDKLLAGFLVPSVKDYFKGDKTAMTEGFVNTIGAVRRAVSASGSPSNVTINKATDNSGFVKVLGWIVGLLALAGFGGGLIYFLMRRRKEQGEITDAQNEASNAWGKVSSGFSELNNPSKLATLDALASSNSDLAPLFDKYKRLARQGGNEFALNSQRGENPNLGRVPASTYQRNKALYEDLVRRYINPARDLERQIRAGKPDAKPAEKPVEAPRPPEATFTQASSPSAPETPPTSPWNRPDERSYQDREPYRETSSYGYTPPQPPRDNSDGLVGGLLGGMVLGDILDRDRDRGRSDRSYEDGMRMGEQRADMRRQQDAIDDERDDLEDQRRETRYEAPDPAPTDDDGGGFDIDMSDDSASSNDDGGGFDIDTSSDDS